MERGNGKEKEGGESISWESSKVAKRKLETIKWIRLYGKVLRIAKKEASIEGKEMKIGYHFLR